MVRATAAAAWCVFALVSCKPDTEGRASLVDGPRILAVRSTPAEARPGSAVVWDALYAAPDSEPDASALDWALCLEPKPLAQSGPISPACLAPSGDGLTPLGAGLKATGMLPNDVCRVFGPTPPDPQPGQPPLRPADPDTSGGYYQPVRVLLPTPQGPEYSVGVTRITCALGGANQDQAAEFAQRARPNEIPALARLILRRRGGADVPLSPDEPIALAPAEPVVFRAEWADCPVDPVCGDGICGAAEDTSSCLGDCAAPHGCTGSEPYVYFDPESRVLVARREAVRVSWFATAGEFDHDRTGRTEDEALTPSSENGWTAPGEPAMVRVWVVVRDDRGGVSWRDYRVAVGD